MPVTVSVAVGDINFTGPVSLLSESGSATFQNAIGGTITDRFFVDPSNTQGATTSSATVQPGTNLFTSTSFTATNPVDSTSYFASQPIVPQPGAVFGMTETFTYTLPAGNAACVGGQLASCPQVISRGQTQLTDDPQTNDLVIAEPTSLAILGAGLAALGLVHRLNRRKRT